MTHISLEEFIKSEQIRLKKFAKWYIIMSEKEPEKYPISLEYNDSGLWYEMFADYSDEEDFYKIK